MENILELLLKEIKEIKEDNKRLLKLITEKEKSTNSRTIETSPKFDEYRDFMDCFKEGEKYLTVGQLLSEFENNFGACAIENRLAGRIFSHFIKDKKMYRVNGTQKMYKLTTI